jgi:hypothetical protein
MINDNSLLGSTSFAETKVLPFAQTLKFHYQAQGREFVSRFAICS